MSTHAPLHLARTSLPLVIGLAFSPLTLFAQTAPAPDAANLPAVKVEESADQETATGPVQGYLATRSATGTKTDTPLAETAQSITVVTRDQMLDQGATNIQDALNYAAGVRSNAYGADSRADSVRVRGVEPVTYLDGLRMAYDYYTSTTRTDPYTLERLEVLRGPAAMLYGQGSTGGIINMVSKMPQSEFQGEAGIQLGNDHRKQAQLDITGPLTRDGQWLYRLVALQRGADTQVDYVPDNRSLIMPTLTWRPSAATSLTLQGLWQKDHSGSTPQFLPWSGMRTDNPNGQIPTNRFIGEPGHDRYDSERSSVGWLFDHRFDDQWSFSQGFRHTNNEVKYFTFYADSFSDPGGWALDPVNRRLIGRYGDDGVTKVRMDTLDQHLTGRLQTGIVRHELLLGVDWTRYVRDRVSGFTSDYPIDVYDPAYGNYTAPTLSAEPRRTLRQTGLYLQDQMRIGRNWIVSAGMRHDDASTSQVGSATEKDNATTKRLGVMFAADNGWSPYVNYSESFTPTPGTDAQGGRFKPLRGQQVEAGVKHESEDGRQMFTAAVYQLKERNQLTGDPGNPLYSIQVGATKTKGVELEWRGSLTRQLDLIAHYNYIDLDKSLEGIPAHQAAAWGKYRFAIAGLAGFSAGAGVRWMSSFTDGAAPATPSVTLFDAMLAYESRHWRYALNLNNLTDKVYVATCLSRGDCWYGARRSVIGTATYKF